MKAVIKILLIIAGGIIGLVVILAAILIISLGGFHRNDAQKDFKPIGAKLTALGGKLMCDNGDSGYSIDNTQPWYQAYYSVPDNPTLTSAIEDVSARSGFSLIADTQRASGLQTGANIPYPNYEIYSKRNDYLRATNGETVVEVVRTGQVALDCNSGTYGRPAAPASGQAIVSYSLVLPDRR